MLHIRDCSGLLSNGDICPFPWCRKAKHLLYHLVTGQKEKGGKECPICCPRQLSPNLTALVGLNTHRRKLFIQRTRALMAAAAKRQQMAATSAAKAKAGSASIKLARTNQLQYQQQQLQKQHALASQHLATSAMHAATTAAALGSSVPTPISIASTSLNSKPTVTFTTNPESSTSNPLDAAHLHSTARVMSSAPSPASTSEPISNPCASAVNPSQAIHVQQASPAITSTLTTIPSPLSASYSILPPLDESVLEIGDIVLSASDLMGDHEDGADIGTVMIDTSSNQAT